MTALNRVLCERFGVYDEDLEDCPALVLPLDLGTRCPALERVLSRANFRPDLPNAWHRLVLQPPALAGRCSEESPP